MAKRKGFINEGQKKFFKNMNQRKFVNIILIIVVVALVGTGAYFVLKGQLFSPSPSPEITNFEKCARAGYPVGESYPRQCWTPDGRNFVEKLTIEAAKELLSQSLLDKPGIVGVGIGECAGEPCIKVMLEKELEDMVIPLEFHGFKVEKEVTGLICTQEAKVCPDGSTVARTGPNCEFAPCPSPLPKKDGIQVSLREGQRESSLLVEKIYPDRITGLNFLEYPLPFERGFPITLRIGEIASNGCTVTLTLTKIEGNIATFIRKTDFNRPCPICLASNTMIGTPQGLVLVKDLQVGMPIWTTDSAGHRISGIITKTSKVPVLPTHQMVHLVLDDGRELLVSPGHPTVDGRTAGDLVANDFYDGARVVSSYRVVYGDVATYDILPSGETGFYWANGILLKSTLH